jgi:hypothetical protein
VANFYLMLLLLRSMRQYQKLAVDSSLVPDQQSSDTPYQIPDQQANTVCDPVLPIPLPPASQPLHALDTRTEEYQAQQQSRDAPRMGH